MWGFSATHAYAHLLADMHLAVFAPAFTFSLCESESSRKPPMPIASVVRCKPKKRKKNDQIKNMFSVLAKTNLNLNIEVIPTQNMTVETLLIKVYNLESD